MATDRVILSEAAKDNLSKLVRRLKLGNNKDYVAARIALARSLATGVQVTVPAGPTSSKAIALVTLTRPYEVVYRALISQKYQKQLSDEQYADFLTYHIEHGLSLLLSETDGRDLEDHLVQLASKGLEGLTIEQRSNSIVPGAAAGSLFPGLIQLDLGVESDTKKKVAIRWNKTDEHPNNYMAVVGKPGSGKTYFVKNLVQQIRAKSDYRVNFIFFDYAKGDVASDTSFVEATRARVIRVPTEPVPINPFWTSSTEDIQKRINAQRFVDTMSAAEGRLGPKQTDVLLDAIIAAYEEQALTDSSAMPDIYDVNRKLQEIYANSGLSADSLTAIMRPLVDFEIFDHRENASFIERLYEQTIIFDIHELNAHRELTVFFILDYLYRQVMLLPDSPVEAQSQARAMRTVLVIDEAHHFLRNKKRSIILEKIIREIRSKGVSVFLLSQSPDDYDQQDFDFLELLEFVFILSSSADSSDFIQKALGVNKERARLLLTKLSSLKRGEALTKSLPGSDKPFLQVQLS